MKMSLRFTAGAALTLIMGSRFFCAALHANQIWFPTPQESRRSPTLS